jgi:hypothetical protein
MAHNTTIDMEEKPEDAIDKKKLSSDRKIEFLRKTYQPGPQQEI